MTYYYFGSSPKPGCGARKKVGAPQTFRACNAPVSHFVLAQKVIPICA